MNTTKYFCLAAVTVIVFSTCASNALAATSNAPNATARPSPTAPTKDAMVTLEKSLYEAWKHKDLQFWNTFFSGEFVGYGSFGKLDKASATKEFTNADCEIRSYTLSNEQMRPLGDDAALITYKNTVDGTCGGQQLPNDSWAASVYVREDGNWKAAFHAQAPVVDPRAAPPKLADRNQPPRHGKGDVAAPSAATDALTATEMAVWDAWREHDAKSIGDLTTSEISFINIFGTFFATKADALKDWTSPGCEVKSVSVTNARATMLSPTVGILTFDGSADGTCFGQKVGPIWGTSVYAKVGNTWKWTFGINLPAR